MTIGLASIILVGISGSYPNPITAVQVNFAAGPTGAAPAGQKVLCLGNKTSSGTATPDTVVYGPDTSVPMQSESDVITLFGAGSQVHVAYQRFSAVNKSTPFYALAVAESAGAQATGVILVTGTATSSGNIRVFYSDQFVDVSVSSGDTPTVIAGNIVTAITNNTRWAVTATNNAGQVTVTAKNHGPEGNWIKYGVMAGPVAAPAGVTVTPYGVVWTANIVTTTGSFIAPATPNGFYYKVTTGGTGGGSPPAFPTTLGTTVSDGTAVYTCWGTLSAIGVASLGGGATADNVTNALATILTTGYRNILVCDSDATNLGRVNTQILSQANPATGLRQRMFAGSVDTLSNTNTIATGLNSARAEIEWGGGGCTDYSPIELAATMCGIFSYFEQSGNTGYRLVGRLNFSRFPSTNPKFNDAAFWPLVASRNGSGSGPTDAQVTSALNNGVSPFRILPSGKLQYVKRVTSYSLNGSAADYRCRDGHKPAVMDAVAEGWIALTDQQFGAMDLLDPPPPNQSPAAGNPPNVFATNKDIWGNALKDFNEKVALAGLLQNVDVTNANGIVQRETSPRTRMSASFDLQPADIADQFLAVANQVA